jgi:LacI family transcriptional regulator
LIKMQEFICKEVISISVTTKSIAKIAGVSQSTVSRSLNDSNLISEDTKKKVKQIAKELGFEFNANARSLKTSNTGTVSLVYPENFDDFSLHLYFSSLYNQIRESLEKADLDLIVTFLRNRFTGQDSIKKLVSRKKVDGFIIVQSNLKREILNFLKQSKIPFVFLHLYPSAYNTQEVDAVYTDHFKGGYLAAEHLIGLGRKKIICLAVAGREAEFFMRTKGFKAAHEDYGLVAPKDFLFYGDRSFKSGYQSIITRQSTLKKVDAVFAHTDLMALGVIAALKELHIGVPEDIAVVGYDDIELCTYFHPYLSTIHQPREEIARLTCERLIELLSTKKPTQAKKLAIEPRLIVRESCGGTI